MTPDPTTILPAVIDAVLTAGQMVAAEFARPDGPRFSDHITAPLDHEIEMMLRDRLLSLVSARFVGEEAGVVEAPANGLCWVVDPHDGTRAFLEGKRGSAVSVALLRHGTPILAVVYAPMSPDRGPDLITWCEGGRIERDGHPVTIDLSDRDLAAGDVVFLNHGAWQRPVWHGQACAPAGFMPLPSIAYRLARLAVGDGIATQTLRPVNALDIAAGHALLMAAGGVLVTEDGEPVTYNDLGESRPSACFGGAPRAVAALRARTWRGSQEPRREPRISLTWPRRAPEAMLDRAAGCLMGLAICGDFSADVELALVIARALVGRKTYDRAAIDAAIKGWVDQGGDLSRASPLARAIPIGLWARTPDAAEAIAREDGPDGIWNGANARAIAMDLESAGRGQSVKPDAVALETLHWAIANKNSVGPGGGSGQSHPSFLLGAMTGARFGRGVFPVQEVMRILTHRPDSGLGAARPRPDMVWTDDIIDLAEALLIQGQRDL